MELNSNLREKLLDNKSKSHDEEKYVQPNRIDYVDNLANIHSTKKFEELDTDQLEDLKKPLINKKDNPKKNAKIHNQNKKEYKTKILKLKVINHFFLVMFTIIQALLILNPITTNFRAQERIFYNIFLENSSKEGNDFNKILYLYDIDELRNHFKQTINNFSNLEKFLLNRIEYLRNYTIVEFFYFEDKYMDNINRELFLKNESLLVNNNNDLSNYNIHGQNDHNKTEEFMDNKATNYKITNESFGPFSLDNKSLKIFLNDVRYFRVHFTFNILTIDEVSGIEKCNEWVIYF